MFNVSNNGAAPNAAMYAAVLLAVGAGAVIDVPITALDRPMHHFTEVFEVKRPLLSIFLK